MPDQLPKGTQCADFVKAITAYPVIFPSSSSYLSFLLMISPPKQKLSVPEIVDSAA